MVASIPACSFMFQGRMSEATNLVSDTSRKSFIWMVSLYSMALARLDERSSIAISVGSPFRLTFAELLSHRAGCPSHLVSSFFVPRANSCPFKLILQLICLHAAISHHEHTC